jgi:hypothetical protein
MRTLTATLALCLCAFAHAFAQPEDDLEDRMDRLESAKVAFITRELNLTTDEAQRFWPVFNEYTDRRKANRKMQRANQDNVRANFGSMSERDLDAALSKALEHEQKDVDLKKEYVARFKTILPVAKVVRLYGAEEKFKREVLKEMKNRGGGPQGGRR